MTDQQPRSAAIAPILESAARLGNVATSLESFGPEAVQLVRNLLGCDGVIIVRHEVCGDTFYHLEDEYHQGKLLPAAPAEGFGSVQFARELEARPG